MKASGEVPAPRRSIPAVLTGFALAFALLWPKPSQAQHIDYLLGIGGLSTAQQPPPSVYFVNQPIFYSAGGSRALGPFNIKAGLDLFIDATTLGWTTPLRVLGANYGMNVTIPFVSTTGSLDVTTANGLFGIAGSKSAFGASSIYVEPIDLGWHSPTFEAVTAFGFFAPAGPYDPHQPVNTGLGRWAELFSLGGTVYSDPARTWSLALEGRYLTHQPQQGIDVRAGDDLIVEGGIGRKFDTGIGPVNVGAVGYAYWQVSGLTGSVVPPPLQGLRGSVYALGPEVSATTRYGQFFVRFFSEFGGANTPQGHELIAGVGLAF